MTEPTIDWLDTALAVVAGVLAALRARAARMHLRRLESRLKAIEERLSPRSSSD